MGYLSQETSIFRKLTVEQNILAILEAMPVLRNLGAADAGGAPQRTDNVLEQFGLTRLRKNSAARLSGGEHRRLEIARCLVCEPLLILLDEPFTGIDPHAIADIQQVVRGLRTQGIGILVTDHHVRETLKITDRSYLIKDGKVMTHGTPRQIVHDPIAISGYLGNSFIDDGLLDRPEPRRNRRFIQNPPCRCTASSSRRWSTDWSKISRPSAASRRRPNCWNVASSAVPDLIEALERRDVEMRRQAFDVLRRLLEGAVFDPYAPKPSGASKSLFSGSGPNGRPGEPGLCDHTDVRATTGKRTGARTSAVKANYSRRLPLEATAPLPSACPVPSPKSPHPNAI